MTRNRRVSGSTGTHTGIKEQHCFGTPLRSSPKPTRHWRVGGSIGEQHCLEYLLYTEIRRRFGSRDRPSVFACGSDISPIELGRGVLLTSNAPPQSMTRFCESAARLGSNTVSEHHNAPPQSRLAIGELASRLGRWASALFSRRSEGRLQQPHTAKANRRVFRRGPWHVNFVDSSLLDPRILGPARRRLRRSSPRSKILRDGGFTPLGSQV